MDFIFGTLLGVGVGYLICDMTRDRLEGIKTIYNRLSPIEVKIDKLSFDMQHAINMAYASIAETKARMDKIEGKAPATSATDATPIAAPDTPNGG